MTKTGFPLLFLAGALLLALDHTGHSVGDWLLGGNYGQERAVLITPDDRNLPEGLELVPIKTSLIPRTANYVDVELYSRYRADSQFSGSVRGGEFEIKAAGDESAADMLEIRQIAWDQLSEISRSTVVEQWREAEVFQVGWKDVPLKKSEQSHEKVAKVVFKTKLDSMLGPIGMYIDTETKEVVGYDARD